MNESALYDLVTGDAVLVKNLVRTGLCAVSPADDRVAVQDSQGTVHVFELERGEEVASRPARDASQLLFTAQGVAVVRSEAIQVFGGSQGEFFVPIPGRGGNGLMGSAAEGVVSRDGNLLVIPRLTSNQADIVDLRVRSVVSSVSFAAGTARLAFSPAGDRILVAGLLNGSFLGAWDIGPTMQPPSVAGSPRMAVIPSDDGQRIFVNQLANPPRLDVYDPAGKRLQTFELGAVKQYNAVMSHDGQLVATFVPDTVSVRDVGSGALVAQLDCANCYRMMLSYDRQRVVTNNGKEIVLWDLGRREPIWRESARAGTLADPLDLSSDGRIVVWGRESTIYVHVVDGGPDRELALDDTLEDARVDHSGRRLVVVSRRSIGVWELDGLRPVFRIANPWWVAQEIRWSRDDSTLLHAVDSFGTELLDGRTGDLFATIRVSKPAALGANELVSPDLSYRVSRGDGVWQVAPLPAPDDAPPGEPGPGPRGGRAGDAGGRAGVRGAGRVVMIPRFPYPSVCLTTCRRR